VQRKCPDLKADPDPTHIRYGRGDNKLNPEEHYTIEPGN